MCLDFETAGLSRTSAVEIGLVKYVAGEPVKEFSTLLRPPDGTEFDEKAVKLHSITEDDVIFSPTFPEIFAQVVDFLEGSVVVGHNVTFDLQVLFSTLAYYELKPPSMQGFICTQRLSGKFLPLKQKTLEAACGYFSITNARAHRAKEDCLATGSLALALAGYLGKDVSDFVEPIPARVWLANKSDGSRSTRATKVPEKALRKAEAASMSSSLVSGEASHPLFGKEVILSGIFNSFSKKQGQILVLKAGGSTGDNLSRKTAFLVSSDTSSNNAKHRKARELQLQGFPLQIITELEFVELLGSVWKDPVRR